MKYFFVVLIFIGCASHSEMASKKARDVISSHKNQEDVKNCIESGWANEYPYTRAVKVPSGEYRIYIENGYGGVIVLALVKKEKSGCTISIHEHAISLASDTTLYETINSCK